jgi:drug/metabolite transporter (DMT)-like permease
VFLARAYAAADASMIASLDFARLPFAVAFGYALFGETIDMWTWIGAGLIFTAGVYIAHRENLMRRQRQSLTG